LQNVIDGTDLSGITQAVNWNGGGGYRYFKLAPSLLRQDAYGQWVINKEYNAEMLAQALCKLEASPMHQAMRTTGCTVIPPNGILSTSPQRT